MTSGLLCGARYEREQQRLGQPRSAGKPTLFEPNSLFVMLGRWRGQRGLGWVREGRPGRNAGSRQQLLRLVHQLLLGALATGICFRSS